MLVVATILGCKKEDIRVYSVPKEKPPAVATVSQQGERAAMPHIHYQTPEGWTEQDPGGMRVARFAIPGKAGNQTDVSVIPLPGVSASKLDIVNLWREQIRLAPLKEEELGSAINTVAIGKASGEMFDMVSTEALMEGDEKARILVAMLKQDEATWFFKMTGDDESVAKQKVAFTNFLASVEFDYSSHGESESPFAGNSKEVPGARREAASAPPSRPPWEVPQGWKEVPPTQMLIAKFVLAEKEKGTGEVTVSAFPGDGGGLLANINRWRGQLKLEPISQDKLPEVTRPLEVPGGKAILVEMSGENPTNGKKAVILAAILPRDEQTWFYKMTADEQAAQAHKNAFVQFVQSAKYGDRP